jgi:small neutral amino acid transporter SnatA (MarC family)
MADVAKRLVGPQYLATTSAVLYTAPAATTTIIRNIHLCNVSSSAITFNLAVNAAATVAVNCAFYGFTVPANGVLDWSGMMPIAATETVAGLASTASALTVILSGVETS